MTSQQIADLQIILDSLNSTFELAKKQSEAKVKDLKKIRWNLGVAATISNEFDNAATNIVNKLYKIK